MKRVLLALLIALVARVALADGLIIIENPERVPGHFPFAPLEVKYHRVNVDIDDRVAVTSVDQEFYNPGSARTEGTYLFPLPPGAHIDKFSMDINGTQADAELLPADKARAIYEDIVRKLRDPALLEYTGRDAFKVRIFPIEPHSTKHIKIRYTQILKEDSGLTEYTYPLSTEKFSSRRIPDVSVKVSIKSPEALKSIYCPTHNAEVKRHGKSEAVVGYEEHEGRPDTDFKVLFSREKSDVGIKLLSTHPNEGEDGYFMLMASPGAELGDGKAAAKDIVFVLDTSGSMADRGKLEQAKKALNFCLANLNEDDRFNIVRFSTEAETFFGELEHPNKDRIAKAGDFIKGLKPSGGTAIDDALATALKCRQGDEDSKKRPFLVVFLTDGAPTVGTTDEDQIVKRATDRASDVRVFCFGIGHDVNTHLLDRIADATRAASQYVLPDEDIELKVSSFYDKVKEPVLTDVKLTFGGEGIKTTQLYPSSLPDLFKGDTLLVFGRYRGDGAASVKLSATRNGKPVDFAEDVRFASKETKDDFIPKMWATRRVGWLLDEIRLHGESGELKDEIVKLSRSYGIVTPYTAYLIMEDETRRNVPELSRTFRELEGDRFARDRSKAFYDSTIAESKMQAARSGPQAVANAQNYGQLKSRGDAQAAHVAGGLDKAMAAAPATQPGYRATQNYTQQVRVVNGRAFYQNGDNWSDSTQQAKKDLKAKSVRFNSDEYFALLRDHPSAAQWLALGNNVDVVIDDTLYSIRDN
jgi:Ca-activated chloride channel family protein